MPDCTKKHDSCFFGPGAPPPDTPRRVPDTPKQRFCARGPLFSDTHTTTHTRTPAHLRIEVNEKITDFKLRDPSQRHPTHPSHREFAQQLSGCAAQVISTYKRQFRSGCRGRGWGMEWGCYIPRATPAVQIYMNLTSLCDQDASAVRAETPRMRAVANRNNCERGWKAPEVHEKIVDFKFPEKAPKRAPDTPKHASSAPKHAQTHPNTSGFDSMASFTCQIV